MARFRLLTADEQRQFRQDVLSREAEIEKTIALYMTAMVLSIAWVIRSDKQLLQMLLDNSGYNIYSLLLVSLINACFLSFATYKNLIVHEYAQFLFYLSPTDCGYSYWESWRRHSPGVSKWLRGCYYSWVHLVAPAAVSATLLFAIYRVLWKASISDLMRWTGKSSVQAVLPVVAVLHTAKWVSIVVFISYLIWILIIFRSLRVETYWSKLLKSKPELPRFERVETDPFESSKT
jgi:hypothetical protein